MSFTDDFSNVPPGAETSPEVARESNAETGPQPPVQLGLPGDPISHAAHPHSSFPGDPISLAAVSPQINRQTFPALPEDLRISWSWLHLTVFLLFAGISLVLIQFGFLLYYAPFQRMTNEKEFERFVLSKPMFAVGSMVLWYAMLLLFLYVTLSVLRGFPFWRSLGWRSLTRPGGGKPRSAWLFFLAGCGLSVLVFIVTAKVQPKQDVPIEELFKYKNTALLFMAMAVLVAPLVEETVFRGYLYPLLAKSFGVVTGVIVTGVLFGLMHGAQLGWTWGLVAVLIFVGVVFTLVRARTGSVFASFLLHLGYNSMIAMVTILGTQGFTKSPPTH